MTGAMPARCRIADARMIDSKAGYRIEERIVEWGGLPIFCRIREAAGEPVLMLHGFTASSDDWLLAIDRISPDYRIVAPDLVGFGRSALPAAPYSLAYYTEFIGGLLDALGIERAHLVGHSMGGKLAVHFALQHPERVSRLALVGSDGFAPVPIWGRVSLSEATIRALVRLSGWKPLFRQLLRRAVYDPACVAVVNEQRIQRAMVYVSDPGHVDVLVALSRNYRQFDLQLTGALDRLQELRMPILLLWGAHDRVFPPRVAARAATLLPTAEYVVLPRSGHLPMLERPDTFAHALLAFLRDARPAHRGRDARAGRVGGSS